MMDLDDLTLQELGGRLALTYGYSNGGVDAVRFYLMHKAVLPARSVLMMGPSELLKAYDAIDSGVVASTALH
jgi:hypothetical protein